MQYPLLLTLQQKAALSVAISLWEKKEVKDKMKEFLSSRKKVLISDAKQEWYELIKIVITESNKNILPPLLQAELIHIIKVIGERIFNWYKFIHHQNIHQYKKKENMINYIDKIYWTPFGTVDEVEIFKSLLLENSKFNITKAYYLACSYALEQHTDNLSTKVLSRTTVDRNCKIFQYIDPNIMQYWIYRQNCSGFNQLFISFPRIASNDHSEEIKMLKLSIYQGHNIAMKYFWNQLPEEERNRNVLECARLAVTRHQYYVQNEQKYKEYERNWCNEKDVKIGCHKKEKYVEICIFLMNQMTEDHKRAFFNKRIRLIFPNEEIDVKDEILKMLLSAWPWQKLFIPVLEDILKYQDHDSTMSCMFLTTITNKIIEDYKLGYLFEMSKYRDLFREAWLIIPETIKQQTILESTKKDLICSLIEVWDLDNLKLILNDPGVVALRDQLKNFAFCSYTKFVLKDQFQRLDQFMENIITLRSEKEKRNFKRRMFFWNGFMDGVDIGNSMRNLSLCQQLIDSGKFDIVDKFINWTFETEKQRKKCINYLKNDEFIIKQVHRIWELWTSKKAIIKSIQFLSWLLESNNKIELFKQEKLIYSNDDNFNFFARLIIKGNLRDFLSWCLLPNEEIERIMQLVYQSSSYKIFVEYKEYLK